MERKKYLVVTAGGSGLRMGSALPKQFLSLDGRAVLQRTIERFVEACPDIQVITVLPEGHVAWWRRYCQEKGFNCPQRLVKGGITRFHSVRNALAHVPDGAVVAIHDGVRPLLSADLIRAMFAQMDQGVRALIPVVPMVDTLAVLDKVSDGSLKDSGELVDRSRVYGVQTPQVFRSEDLKAAYAQGYDTLFTDDASVARRYGIPLSYIAGERNNIKLTTQEDLLLAEAILRISRG
ncbi:MAG: 2-C-methyl-D-erythritol 4-phosphate cytidylyltransferase [Bacteroidales bacterium]|jgi:2-C-methyl-D-erythritol 4-phosphate cytidylyltransferase|nr:2-C-methyl-D-erythritol 4-phosphate cytidylyltransferase [Bacteroidales bacterium]